MSFQSCSGNQFLKFFFIALVFLYGDPRKYGYVVLVFDLLIQKAYVRGKKKKKNLFFPTYKPILNFHIST